MGREGVAWGGEEEREGGRDKSKQCRRIDIYIYI